MVELLVVITIIAVLASMLLPVLSRVRASAKSMQCLSNVKSMGSALSMYSGDYNDYLPSVGVSSDSTWWPYLLSPYLGGPFIAAPLPMYNPGQADNLTRLQTIKTYRCPDREYTVGGDRYAAGYSYGMNHAYRKSVGSGVYTLIKHTRINQPALRLAFKDSYVQTWNYNYARLNHASVGAYGYESMIFGAGRLVPGIQIPGNWTAVNFDHFMNGRHGNKLACAFFDGHATGDSAKKAAVDFYVNYTMPDAFEKGNMFKLY